MKNKETSSCDCNSNDSNNTVGNENLKDLVKSKYGQIASNPPPHNQSSCCGTTSCCGESDYTIFSESYNDENGYNPDADYGLGCGIPTQYAGIKKGDTVIDLGSGAGNDCFVAREIVGEEGLVIGLDFTPEMIVKAKANASKLGFTNVKFRLGDIEEMPITAEKADVVVSNCVLNLVPDKAAAFYEIYRVLKPGGHFAISDVVLKGELSEKLKNVAELYAGCVSGAIQKSEYLEIVKLIGFENINVVKQKEIEITDDMLKKYITEEEILQFRNSGTGIFSITVCADKPVCNCKKL